VVVRAGTMIRRLAAVSLILVQLTVTGNRDLATAGSAYVQRARTVKSRVERSDKGCLG
jgi:hypothetical protein